MINNNWSRQYKRMLRWKNYIVELSSNSELDLERLHDYFFSFFNNCNHLGEWLKEFGFENAINYRNADKYLDICRALSNGDKHFLIDKYKSTYKSKAYRTHYKQSDFITTTSSTGFFGYYHHDDSRVPIKPSHPLKDGDIIIQTDTEIFDAFLFMDCCIRSWQEYLKKQDIDLELL